MSDKELAANQVIDVYIMNLIEEIIQYLPIQKRKYIKDTIIESYIKLREYKLTRGHKVENIIAALTFYVCKKNKVSIPAGLFNMSNIMLYREYNRIKKFLGEIGDLDFEVYLEGLILSSDILKNHPSRDIIMKESIKVYDILFKDNKEFLSGKNMSIIAAAILYLVCKDYELTEEVTQQHLSKIINRSDYAIRRYYKSFKDLLNRGLRR
ncbi:MAG: hypothetical protein QXG40_04200 [Ignisphaera sp.]